MPNICLPKENNLEDNIAIKKSFRGTPKDRQNSRLLIYSRCCAFHQTKNQPRFQHVFVRIYFTYEHHQTNIKHLTKSDQN